MWSRPPGVQGNHPRGDASTNISVDALPFQGKYVEAEIAKNRLEELKLHEENRRKEAMRSRQLAERLGVEEAHMLEYQQFNMVGVPWVGRGRRRVNPHSCLMKGCEIM